MWSDEDSRPREKCPFFAAARRIICAHPLQRAGPNLAAAAVVDEANVQVVPVEGVGVRRGAERSISAFSICTAQASPALADRPSGDVYLRTDILLDGLASGRAEAPQSVVPSKGPRTLRAEQVLEPPFDRPHQPLGERFPAGCSPETGSRSA